MQHAAAAGSIRTSSYNVPGCLLYVPRYVAICRALRAAAARRRRYRLRACTAHLHALASSGWGACAAAIACGSPP
jgi:hypothetical protein